MWRVLVVGVIGFGCVETSVLLCDNGKTCPEDHLCDTAHGIDGGCITQGQLDVCSGAADGTACTAALVDEGFCDLGVCLASRCGDGYRAAEEICDGTKFATISTCGQVAYYNIGEPLKCSATCELDTSSCMGTCGDNQINGPEICDGLQAPNKSCVDFGYGAGQIGCAVTCGPELGRCIPFGWTEIAMPSIVLHMHGTSASNIWVVGSDKMIQRYNGTSWSALDVSTCATRGLSRVFVLSATDAFVVDGDAILRITAAGCTRHAVNGEIQFNALWATSIDDAYVGTATGLYRFAGTSWSLVFNGASVNAIWGTSSSNIWLADGTTNQLRHYTGGNWNTIEVVPDTTIVTALWGTAAGDFYASGAGDTVPGHPIVKHYVNGTWTTVLKELRILGVTGAGSTASLGATLGARSYVLARANNDRLYLLASDGTGWANMEAPLPIIGGTPYLADNGQLYLAPQQDRRIYVFTGSTLLETPLVPNPAKVFAGGAHTAAVLNGTGVLWHWDGTTWTARTLATDVTNAVTTPGGEVLFGSFTQCGVRRLETSGSLTCLFDIKPRQLAAISSSDFWAVTDTTSVTHRSGVINTPMTLPLPGPTALHAATATLAFAGFYVGPGQPAIARWTGGTTWTLMPTPIHTIDGFHAASATDVFAWGGGGQLIHYDGTSWSLWPTLPLGTNVNGVWGSSSALFLAGNDGLHYYDGQRWTPVESGDPFPVRSVSGHGDSIYFATQNSVRQLLRTQPW